MFITGHARPFLERDAGFGVVFENWNTANETTRESLNNWKKTTASFKLMTFQNGGTGLAMMMEDNIQLSRIETGTVDAHRQNQQIKFTVNGFA
jgi:hypothetical protein